MITAFISGKVVSHNRDSRPIIIMFSTNDSKTNLKITSFSSEVDIYNPCIRGHRQSLKNIPLTLFLKQLCKSSHKFSVS